MKIYTDTPEGTTVIQNSFIDQYMPHANGEFVKVYLYLLRCANTGRELSLSSIADVFEHTEKDIQRALAYWEKQRLLSLKLTSDGALAAVTFTNPSLTERSYGSERTASGRNSSAGRSQTASRSSSGYGTASGSNGASGYSTASVSNGASGYDTASGSNGASGYNTASAANGTAGYDTAGSGLNSAPVYDNISAAPSPERLAELREQKDLRQLFFIAEQYLQRPLNSSEQSDFIYYYDTLHFSTDLIEYLLEYCISKGSVSRHYMRRVALAWAEAGITTVLQAKQETNLYNKNYFAVMNTFGIKGRNPAAPEQEIMSRWLNEFKFPLDIILEACSRTIRQTHQPNFQYADKILEQWHKSGVKSLADVEKLDLQRLKEQQKKAAAKPQKSANNRFNNFTQREYDYSQLEKQLLNQ